MKNLLNFKPPYKRHFFVYKQNGEIKNGIEADYLSDFNTVVRPDIDVLSDIQAINRGEGGLPTDYYHLLKVLELASIPALFVFFCTFLLYKEPFLLIILFLLIISIHLISSSSPVDYFFKKIASLRKEMNQPEWQINDRVYGEYINPENNEKILYPKRGNGFYALSALEYLKLYTLQFYAGDIEKSKTLFSNTRKALTLKKVIKKGNLLWKWQENKVIATYKECHQKQTQI